MFETLGAGAMLRRGGGGIAAAAAAAAADEDDDAAADEGGAAAGDGVGSTGEELVVLGDSAVASEGAPGRNAGKYASFSVPTFGLGGP